MLTETTLQATISLWIDLTLWSLGTNPQKGRISLKSKTFVILVLNCLRLSFVVFSWSKDVGSVQVLRISLNSETFLNNPM